MAESSKEESFAIKDSRGQSLSKGLEMEMDSWKEDPWRGNPKTLNKSSLIKEVFNYKNPFEALADLDVHTPRLSDEVFIDLTTSMRNEIIVGNEIETDVDPTDTKLSDRMEGVGKLSSNFHRRDALITLPKKSLKISSVATKGVVMCLKSRGSLNGEDLPLLNRMEVDFSQQETYTDDQRMSDITKGNSKNQYTPNSKKGLVGEELSHPAKRVLLTSVILHDLVVSSCSSSSYEPSESSSSDISSPRVVDHLESHDKFDWPVAKPLWDLGEEGIGGTLGLEIFDFNMADVNGMSNVPIENLGHFTGSLIATTFLEGDRSLEPRLALILAKSTLVTRDDGTIEQRKISCLAKDVSEDDQVESNLKEQTSASSLSLVDSWESIIP
eukprot:Gb_02338 [translate_table: standard]